MMEPLLRTNKTKVYKSVSTVPLDEWPTEIMRMRRTMAPAMPKYKAR